MADIQAPLPDLLSASQSIYTPRLGQVIDVATMTSTEKLLTIEMADGHAIGHRPGQFLQISVAGIGEAPISICTSPTESSVFSICVRRAGSLTSVLHTLSPDDWIGLRGPFGIGFPMEASKGMDLLFVAGGIGLAPLRSAIRYALDRREHYGDIHVLIGAVSPDALLFRDEIRMWVAREDVDVHVTVDRGSSDWPGAVGVITTLFPRVGKLDADRTVAMVVGPPVMYRFVMLELAALSIPEKQILFSVERRMKCGVGKCGHCQINGTYVCKEGPVFAYPRLEQLWEAVERVGPVLQPGK